MQNSFKIIEHLKTHAWHLRLTSNVSSEDTQGHVYKNHSIQLKSKFDKNSN